MKSELTFFVDTASEKGFMGLYEGEQPLHISRFPSADKMMPEMEALFKSAKIEPQELSCIGAGMGPGSFTGIRIGVMAARALAFALQIPQIGLSSLSIYSRDYPVLADARVGGFWAQFPGLEPELIPPEQIANRLQGFERVLSPDVRLIQKRLSGVEEVQSDPLLIGQLLVQARGNKNPEIVYLRKTQAEM